MAASTPSIRALRMGEPAGGVERRPGEGGGDGERRSAGAFPRPEWTCISTALGMRGDGEAVSAACVIRGLEALGNIVPA